MKYELTKETKIYAGVTLYRIKALKSFSNVTKGDLGGFIQKESNLSQNGSCWVYGSARVMGNAWVYDSACVYDNARLWADHKVETGCIKHGVTKFHEVIYG